MLQQLNLYQGYEDSDYPKMYVSNVKTVPNDDTVKILLVDQTTFDWNPLIFSIFYQRLDMVQYFCECGQVYVRNCLTTPFIIETFRNEDDEPDEAEKFITEKTEIFPLVLCIMLENTEIFKYLWKKCSYLWNDIHLILLVNYIFEAHWQTGLEVLLTSPHTNQLFLSMNAIEKEKFLKFCERSAMNETQSWKQLLKLLCCEPYNVFYLPLLLPLEDINTLKDKPRDQIVQFINDCKANVSEWSYHTFQKSNRPYLEEFLTTAGASQIVELANLARTLKSRSRA